jgi:Mn2+/Fe2+ NRAMP family transporter
MLMLINKEKLMGKYKNGPWFNGIAWATTVIMIGLTAYLVFSGVQDLFA